MKNLILALVLVFSFAAAHAQAEYTSLPDALKNPSGAEAIIFDPSDNVSKFIKRKEKFQQVTEIYIRRGFTGEKLAELMAGIGGMELDEVIIECDTLTQQIALLAGLQQTDRITLLEPYVLKQAAIYDIGKLSAPSLSLKSSAEIILPGDFSFNPGLEELEIKARDTKGNVDIINKLGSLPKLVSLSIAADSITGLPSLTNLTTLKSLEVIKTSDLNKPEEKLFTQKLRMAKEANECSRLVTVNFNTTTVLTDTEKASLINTFGGFYFVAEKSDNIKSITGKISEITNTEISQETFEALVGFKPLVMQTDVKRSKFTFNTEQPVKINVQSGTVIRIPANAFVDAEGNPVTGDVQLTYREMKTPLDMLMSGVPMAYDSAGTTYQFQSAGNFEILAFQNGEDLQLAGDKQINIEYASTDANGEYNLYKFDKDEQNWVYETSANESVNTVQTNAAEKGITILTEIDSSLIKNLIDFTPYTERFTSTEHFYMLDANQEKGRVLEAVEPKRRGKNKEIRRTIGVNKKSILVRVKVYYDKNIKSDSVYNVKFTLVQKKNNIVNSVYFPELATIPNQWFYVKDAMTRRQFRETFVKKKKYFDVRLDYAEGDDVCLIHLKHADGIVTIQADLKQGKEGSVGKRKIKFFARKYKKYKKSYDNRINRLEAGLDYRKEEAIAKMYKLNNQSLVRTRSVNIPSMGPFNFDRPIILFQTYPSEIENVIVRTEDGAAIQPTIVYVVDTEINGVLTYNPSRVQYRKKTTKTIIAVDAEKNIYSIYTPVKNAVDGNKISMKKIDTHQLKTQYGFAQMVGL